MVFVDTMMIDMDAFDLGAASEYLRKDFPQLLYLKYRRDVKYLDVVSTEKIPNMYSLYQQLLVFQEESWKDYVTKAWKALREERNRRLRDSDWTQLEDAKQALTPEVGKIWCIYRQYLRDLPANTMDPFNPSWPTMPQMS